MVTMRLIMCPFLGPPCSTMYWLKSPTKFWRLLFPSFTSPVENPALVEVFYCILLENLTVLKNISCLLQKMMTLSVSTAICERGFLNLNKEKASLPTRSKHQVMSCTLVLVLLVLLLLLHKKVRGRTWKKTFRRTQNTV